MNFAIRAPTNLLRNLSRRKIAVRKSSTRQPWQWPKKEGLYDPRYEKEGCGVGMLVSIDGEPSSKIMLLGRRLSLSMQHRGGMSYDSTTGDGAGILTAVPHHLYAHILKQQYDVVLPPATKYATGLVFLDNNFFKDTEEKFEELAAALDLSVVAWRDVPVDSGVIGELARHGEPLIKQVFVVANPSIPPAEHDCRYYILRKKATHMIPTTNRRFHICSLSSRTIVYKGHLTAEQLWIYFSDLLHPNYLTNQVLVHNRFATNTFPSWERAHPFGVLCHNGEINTLRGNLNWMRAREATMKSDVLGEELEKIYPVIENHYSDSASLDCMVEFLMHAGKRSLPEVVMTLIPEAWHQHPTMPDEIKTFYKWSACAIEPWDGPALIAFTDGRYVGAVQDRNGLRPSRFYLTKNNLLVMGSEIDMYDIEDPSNIIVKSRLRPGRILLVDVQEKKLIRDADLKRTICQSRPHVQWVKEQLLTMDDFRKAAGNIDVQIKPASMNDKRLLLFDYFPQIVNMQLLQMIKNKREALGSMGNDTPLACLSQHSPLLYEYFKQDLAQITNPPVDPIRENIVMSLECPIGPAANLLSPSAEQAHRLWLENPILSMQDMEVLKLTTHRNWSSAVIQTTFNVNEGIDGVNIHLERMSKEAEEASKDKQFIILSDRNVDSKWVPIRMLLALGAVHNHLLNVKTRMNVAILVETAEAKLVHDMAVLLGYGADAICPYFVFELGAGLRVEGILSEEFTDEIIFNNYTHAISQGLLNVMARAGINVLQSYKNAQIFEAIGLSRDIIEVYFKGTPSRLGGLTMKAVACETVQKHQTAYQSLSDRKIKNILGVYHYRPKGEVHMNSAEGIALLQEAAQLNNVPAYRQFRKMDDANRQHCLLRGQLELKTIHPPIPFGEIESVEDIIKRFSIAAINLGSVSDICHKTLSKAMNQIGSKSNCGDGGEFPERYKNRETRCKVKQLSSGRWGVTSAYLAHSEDLQIKIAQGTKPGEGGLLSAEKNTPYLAKLWRTPEGVQLIGPFPHYDIFSIEDLSQLIYELNCANPEAKISVKLAAVAGIGMLAAGAVKCKARHIVISGHDGGTAAATWTSIKHAAVPWELGVSEVHQVLTKNHLRKQVTLQVDGQIRTGFDVVVAALLGADEIALATSGLIALGCVMTRKCHLNICPVGIATVNPELVKFFKGKPEYLVNYLTMLAHDVRFHMASIGVRNFEDMIGRTDLLAPIKSKDYRTKTLDFKNILFQAKEDEPKAEQFAIHEETDAEKTIDPLVEAAMDVIDGNTKTINIEMNVTNRNRAIGTRLSYHISKKYGEAGLPDDFKINLHLSGTAGQSFCAFLVKGVTCTLEGDANDYVGKGLSGGTVIIFPPKEAAFESHLNVIAGNVCLYGATSGKMFLRGIAGERFAVRNSGVTAVVEGVGDHCCECMTGGVIVVIGLTGRNFGSGMMGGVAYVWDVDKKLRSRCKIADVKLLGIEDRDEIHKIKDLLYEFKHATGSYVAEQLLKEFNQKVKEFVKIIPRYQYEQKAKSAEAKAENEEKLDRKLSFMKYPRDVQIFRPVGERIKDFDEIYNFEKIYQTAPAEAARCIDCAVPFCQAINYGCPLENMIPNWTFLVFQNRWQEAVSSLLLTNNFPEFTSRVCPAPCEHACVLSLSLQSVAVRNIECTIIDKAFENRWIKPEVPKNRTDKRVAIIGSGPSGLACGDQLNKIGHQVTIFERNTNLGGLLYYGIPNWKLDKTIVKRRVDILKKEGIKFRNETNVGKDVSVEELERQFDVIVLCIGTTLPRDLKVPGRKLKGIYLGLDFLKQCIDPSETIKENCAHFKDKNVIVVGAGQCGMNCVSAAIRYGAKSVKILTIDEDLPIKRLPQNRWPNKPHVKQFNPLHKSAQHLYGEDCRVPNTKILAFENNDTDRVHGVKTIKVNWVNDTGRLKPKHIPGTEKTIPADYVIIATGFTGPDRGLIDECRLECRKTHTIKTRNYSTNEEFIFAAGDCRTGESLVVSAIADGRRAAKAIDTFLTAHGSSSPLYGNTGLKHARIDCNLEED